MTLVSELTGLKSFLLTILSAREGVPDTHSEYHKLKRGLVQVWA